MIIRLATTTDLNRIMAMYKDCVVGMQANGIDQWDATYPDSKTIAADISEKTYYVALIHNELIAGINIDHNQDPAYLTMPWTDNGPFMVVHRLGAHPKVWKQKIGKKMMLYAEELAASKNCSSIRLDTYSGNAHALEFYRRLQYNQLGSIKLKPNKNEYYCFEKKLKK